MDPNPNKFPILHYVMSRLPSIGPRRPTTAAEYDVEQPPLPSSPSRLPPKEPYFEITERMPHLSDPKLISAMRTAVLDVSQTRSMLQSLGERPDHESVDTARAKLAEIESNLSNQLDEISLSPRPDDVDQKQDAYRKAAEKERQLYKALISLDEMHDAYEKLLQDAEKRLEKIYATADDAGETASASSASVLPEEEPPPPVAKEVNEEVVTILKDALGKEGVERIDLSQRRLPFLPEAFGRIRTLVALNLSANQLEVIPDSIAGLENLEELNLSTNILESLPDSIGLLLKLKILDVSSNKLTALPDSISRCRSLEELDASFNKLSYLPTNIGYELVNLRRLSIHLNKIRSLPTSIGEMKSLRLLDVHFNELRGLPLSIGRLSNLEVLNLSSNFSDLTELPDTIGDLINLKELDVSNNQIHELPVTFGRLDNLTKLNVDQNPLMIPPKEVVKEGIEAVKVFMAKRWLDLLIEEEEKSSREVSGQAQAGWLSRSTSWLTNAVSEVSGTVTGYLGPKEKSNADSYLDKQL